MPKAGFKSITVSENVYDRFQEVYQKNKSDLAMKGVNSFSGYVTYMLEEMMQKDKTFARYAPKIEKISVDDVAAPMDISPWAANEVEAVLLKLAMKRPRG